MSDFFPANQLIHIKSLGKRLAVALLAFTLCRVFFYALNTTHFPNAGTLDFLHALRFDASAICWVYLPFIFFSILPFGIQSHSIVQILLKVLFHLSNTACIILNSIDIAYFQFTLKRSTYDLIQLMQTNEDVVGLIPTFLRDFWYVVLFGLLLIFFSEWLYKKTQHTTIPPKTEFAWKGAMGHSTIILCVGLWWLIFSRGGLQGIPISVVDAGTYSRADHVPLVLNTPFAFMKSLEGKTMKHVGGLSISRVNELIPTQKKGNPEFDSKQLPNIAILVLESFSKEYIGYFNPKSEFTPFLDELLSKSLVFKKCFANGKRSAEGIPAIITGVPSLMEQPFIWSSYAANKVHGLPHLLKKIGYNSSFYHGGNNGTMRLEAFCDLAGFDSYIGRSQYPEKEGDFDGKWGIFDEPFFQFFAEELDQKEQPFFTTFFSLSSHHPYKLPHKHEEKFKEGKQPILKTIAYTDYALHRFFETAQQKPWFNNTLFIITADHTSTLITPQYNNIVGHYAIPLAFYWPAKDSLFLGEDNRVTQQIDILPFIMDIVKYPHNYFAYGNNYNTTNPGFSISYLYEKYQWIEDDFSLRFDGTVSSQLYNYIDDPHLKNNLVNKHVEKKKQMEERLRAFVQLYQHGILNNKMSVD